MSVSGWAVLFEVQSGCCVHTRTWPVEMSINSGITYFVVEKIRSNCMAAAA